MQTCKLLEWLLKVMGQYIYLYSLIQKYYKIWGMGRYVYSNAYNSISNSKKWETV